MWAYIVKRLLLVIPTMFLILTLVFFLVRFIPGSVIDLMLEEQGGVTEEAYVELERALGLDIPVHIVYVRWVGDVLRGDLGTSLWKTGLPVSRQILERLPLTLELAILGIVVSLLIALPVGVYSAIRQDTMGDYLGRSLAIACIALPSFWVGTMVIVFPSVWWNWSPPVFYVSFIEDPIQNLAILIIPATILGMVMSGATMRMVRTMMLEVLRQDYIRTAWSKGLMERTVITRHALKNALIPVITVVALYFAYIVGGSVIIEEVFCLPGLGRLALEAVQTRDYPMISGVNLVFAFFVLIINLITDLTYGFLDPRVRYK